MRVQRVLVLKFMWEFFEGPDYMNAPLQKSIELLLNEEAPIGAGGLLGL